MDDNKLNLTDNGTLRNSSTSIIIQDEKTLSEQTKGRCIKKGTSQKFLSK